MEDNNMFVFDEDLFNKAFLKITTAKSDLMKTILSMDKLSISSLDSQDQIEFKRIHNDLQAILMNLNVMIYRSEKIKCATSFLANNRFSSTDLTLSALYNSLVFKHSDNLYGSDQRSAYLLYEKYILDKDSLNEDELQKIKSIILLFEKKGITDENQIDYLLNVSANSGCGYSIIVNIICDLFKDSPEQFEKEYGYPLFYEAGEDYLFNYEALFTDIFLNLNSNELTKIANDDDSVARVLTNLGLSIYGTDVKFDDMAKYLNTVSGTNFNASIHLRDNSIKTYKQHVMNGDYDYAAIAVYAYTLKPYGSNPNKELYKGEGGHWMQITGISKNNHFIVSSWGESWELINSSPYFLDKSFIFQPKSEDDGGLIFFKVGDINGK